MLFEHLEARVPPGSMLFDAITGARAAAVGPSADPHAAGIAHQDHAATAYATAQSGSAGTELDPIRTTADAAGRDPARHDAPEQRARQHPRPATDSFGRHLDRADNSSPPARPRISTIDVGLGIDLDAELDSWLDKAADERTERRSRSPHAASPADGSSPSSSSPSVPQMSGGSSGTSGGTSSGSAGESAFTGPHGSSSSFSEMATLPRYDAGSASPTTAEAAAPDTANAPPPAALAAAPAAAIGDASSAAAGQTAAPSAAGTHLGFDNGLDGWIVNQSGGSLDGHGVVTAGSVTAGSVTAGSAVLHEGDSFLVTLQQAIVIPENPVSIEFTYIASFDTTDPDFINDAFEVALTDADGYSLVDTYTGPRDAYFNLTEGMPAALGSGTTHTAVSSGHKVTVDIADVPPGSAATLTFRLVNNDTDTETTVTILSVDVLSQATPPSVTIDLLNDTAPDGPGSEPYRTDLLTSDPTVTGTATDDEGVVQLEVRINDGPFVDITAALFGNTYTFDPRPLPPGPHRVTVRATDQHGNTGLGSLDFRVNTPPVANAGPDRTVDEGSQVTFGASGSFDAEGALFAYQWTFHDNTTVAGISASRNYPQDGVYPVGLTVTDTAGSLDTHTIDVVVANVPPTVVTAADITGLQGESLSFTVTFTDPGIFDTHTARIDWGDGTVAPTAVNQASGGGTVTASHIYTVGGTYTIRVEVTDDAGDSGDRLAIATVDRLLTSSLSGYVYLDVNNNGIKDPPERGLPNVPIALDGLVTRIVVSAADGLYRFDDLPAGTYEVVQTQPLAFDDGRDTQGTPLLGSVENNRFYDIELPVDVHAVGYNFGELGLRAELIGKQLLLASTLPAGQLLAQMMVPGGEWYSFRAAAAGTATANVPANVSEPVIQIYTADMKPVAMSNGQHQLTAPVEQDVQYVLHVSGQAGEAEFQPTLEFNATPPPTAVPLAGRTNPNNRLDVNADGQVTPQDALILINALSAASVSASLATASHYLDVNGNGLVTPADVLMVINHCNAASLPASWQGEGELTRTYTLHPVTHFPVKSLVQAQSYTAEGENSPVVPPLASASVAPPVLSAVNPSTHTEHLAGRTLLLSGTARAFTEGTSGGTPVPNRITAVLVNGVGVEALDVGGNFFTRVDILPGENVFHVTALDASGQTAETTVTVFGSPDPGGHVDLLFDVSPSFAPLYARTSFDERGDLLLAELAIRNVGQYPGDNPFYVGVRNISDPTITVRETVGTTRDGTPYYNFSEVLPGDTLAPEGVTGFVNALLHNPNRVQFTYDLVFLAKLNEPPAFTTVPIVETHAGWTYGYDADAMDPDGDPLTYSLLSGPQAMSIDPATGEVAWLPVEANLGVHPVILRVHDGRGGSAEQRYLLSVTETPPNRPPNFVSVPVTEAMLSRDGEATYHYDAVAIDPDLDPLTYSLVEHPERMTIDATTGIIRWAPTPDQVRDHDVIVQASDSRGGVAQQGFIMRVTPDSLNRPPFFVSVPPTSVAIRDDQPAGPFRYDAIAIDPDDDPVTYALLDGPDGMTMDPTTGLLSWDAPPDLLQRHALQLFDGDFLAGDWEQTAYYIGRTGSTSVQRYTSGGNPGAYRRTTTTVPAATSTQGNTTYSIHRYTPVTVNPVEFGAILSVSYSEDIRRFSGNPQAAGIAVFQDGQVFLGPSQNTGYGTTWTSRGFDNLIARDFRRFESGPVTSGVLHPDFSLTGQPIQFGFYRSIGNGLQSSGFSGVTGIDNWRVTVTPDASVAVAIQANDPRGSRAVQGFTLTATNAALIQGAVFHDANRDRAWEQPQSLVVGTSTRFALLQFDADTGAFRHPFTADASPVWLGPHASASAFAFAFAFAADGTLYVTRYDTAQLVRVAVDSAEIAVIAEGGPLRAPSGIAMGEDGTIYVCDAAGNNVLRFDLQTGAFLGVFAAHSAMQVPHDLAFGPDGDLYVLGNHSRTIHRFNGQTGAFKSSFSVSPSDLGNYMTFGPDGLIYVTGIAENRVRRYQPSGQLVDTFIPAGHGGLNSPRDLEFGPDGNLYIANPPTNQVLVYAGATGAHLGALETPELSAPWRLAFSPVMVGEPEAGVEGWTVFNDANRNGRLDDGEQSTVTDDSGRFVFENVGPGENWIVLQGQPGWQRTYPPFGTQRVVVAPAEDRYRVDFGVAEGLDPSQPNTAPEISPADTLEAFVNELFLFRPLVDDVDGDPLLFSLPAAPSGMTVHPTLGTIVWQPTTAQLGQHQFVVKVEDGRGGLAIELFTVQVNAPNTAPVITSMPPSLAVVDLPLHYAVYAQDAEQDPIQFRLENEPDGMAIDTQTGLLTWTPTGDQLGGHTFSIVVSDGRGGQAVQAVAIEVVATAPNDPPVINSPPRLRARVGQLYGYLIDAHDPNGDPLSYHLGVRPTGMTVDAAGVVLWQAPSDLLGTTQSVSLRVEDGRGGVATQEFQLVVVSQDSNQAPIIISTPPLTGIVGQTYQYQLAARDPEGDPVMWSLDSAPAGMSIDPLRGTLRWTPAADQRGSHGVVVRVQDIFLASSKQAFDLTIRAVNLPPSIRSTPPVLANPDELYVYAVRAIDPDGDPLSFRLAVQPDGMTIDQRTGLVRWTPSAAAVGQHTVRIVVEDGQGGIDSQTYTLHVGQQPFNRPPVITSTPIHYATADRLYQYALAAYDPEGGSVTYSLERQPDGMAVDPNSGLITWTPGAGSLADHTVTVVVTDDAGARATQSYILSVRPNQPPQITPPPDQLVAAGASYRYDVRATDPERDAITFMLDAAPGGMTIDPQGRIAWRPTAADIRTHTVQVTARDAYGATDTASYALTVIADTKPPRVSLSASTTLANLGAEVVFYVDATDNVGVESLGLTVGGTAVAVGADGRATVPMIQPGLVDAVATTVDAAGNTATSNTWQVRVQDPNDQQAPKVTIHSPASQAVVNYRADVVISVEDDNLDYWRVEYAPVSLIHTADIGADNPNCRLLASGTEVVNQAVVGMIDGTVLANDAYFLRVVAFDINGLGWIQALTFSVAGEAKLGNFAFAVTDFAVSLAGIPITISRSYDTLQAKREGDFGFGWSMAIANPNIAETTRPGKEMQPGDRVFLTNPEGKRVGFTYDPLITHSVAIIIGHVSSTYKPRFKPDPGVYDTLTVKEGSYIRGGVFGGIAATLSSSWNPSQYVLTTRDGTKYEYIQDKGLQKISDPHGNVVTFTKTAITHSAGEQVQLVRDARGRITQIIDTAGNSLSYQYDAVRDLVGFTNQIGDTTRYVYRNTPAHFLDEIYNSLNVRVFKAEFDDDGRLTGSTDALGNVVQQDFDPGAFSGTITDARGNVTTIWYDQQGNVTQEQSAPVLNPITGDAVTYTKTYEYTDPRHPDKETKIVEYDGTIVEHQYDAAGNTIKTIRTSADGSQAVSTSFGYDARNNLTKLTMPGGGTSTFGYTGNNATSVTSALGQVAHATYDSQGRQTSFTDFNGNTTTYVQTAGCSSCNAPARVTHPDGSYELRQTNRQGLVTRTDYYEADGTLVYVTTTAYDRLGRKTRETVGMGADEVVTTYAYHGSTENVTRQTVVHPTDPTQNRVTHYFYDGAGNLIRQVDPDLDPSDPRAGIFFKYDANGNRVWLMDPVGNVTTWIYDALGRVIEERDPLYWHGTDWASMADAQILTLIGTPTAVQAAPFAPSHITRYAYNEADSLVEQIDRNGRRRTFEYDRRGNMSAEVWYDATDDVTPIRDLVFTYDTAGNMLTAVDPDAEYVFTYDTMNRLKTMSVDYPWATSFDTFTLSYQYDAMGNVISATDSTGVAVKSTYDSRNRLDSRWWEGDEVDNIRADFAYTAAGRLDHVDRWADKERTTSAGSNDYAYDLAGRPREITHKNAVDEVLANYDYEFDFSGLLTKETLTHINAAYNRTADYGYDQRGQLISALYDNDQEDGWYAYDANGNRTLPGYVTGAGNQLLSDGVFEYTYDGAGNMVTKTRITTEYGEVNFTEYEYDFRNRMTRVAQYSKDPTEGGIILHEESYRYDALGRRIQVISDGEETINVYDGAGFMANEWARFNSVGEVVQRFLFTNNVDQLVVQWTPADGGAWALTDHLGSIRDMMSNGGQIVQHIHYTVFGAPTFSNPGRSMHPYAFTGRVWDSIPGMSFHRARFYDVQTGRFVSGDPVGFAGGTTNLFQYVSNSPLNGTDPSGNFGIIGYASILLFVGVGAGVLWGAKTHANKVYGRAIADAIALYGKIDHDARHGIGDAYKHCLTTMYLAVTIGPRLSLIIGAIHESKFFDGRGNLTAGDYKMDWHNNLHALYLYLTEWPRSWESAGISVLARLRIAT